MLRAATGTTSQSVVVILIILDLRSAHVSLVRLRQLRPPVHLLG